ncbi:MAG: hypothetical protein IKE63_05965 [Bacilli bacterium]|nr:hypothetical protein [Bacilli bacterium]
MFKELTNDPFYIEYKKCNRCVLDYFIIESNLDHKDVLLYAMNKIKEDDSFITIDKDKMIYKKIDSKELFQLPNDYEKERHNLGNGYKRPYWFLFLDPPHKTNYKIDDFIKINNILFPKGKDNLEIYDWNVEWSNYFDDGLEWWGAAAISIYDKLMNRYVIILASSTD